MDRLAASLTANRSERSDWPNLLDRRRELIEISPLLPLRRNSPKFEIWNPRDLKNDLHLMARFPLLKGDRAGVAGCKRRMLRLNGRTMALEGTRDGEMLARDVRGRDERNARRSARVDAFLARSRAAKGQTGATKKGRITRGKA